MMSTLLPKIAADCQKTSPQRAPVLGVGNRSAAIAAQKLVVRQIFVQRAYTQSDTYRHSDSSDLCRRKIADESHSGHNRASDANVRVRGMPTNARPLGLRIGRTSAAKASNSGRRADRPGRSSRGAARWRSAIGEGSNLAPRAWPEQTIDRDRGQSPC